MRDLVEILKNIVMWIRYLLTPVNIVIVLLFALLILSGCTSKPEPAVKVVVQEMKVPVYMPCIDKKTCQENRTMLPFKLRDQITQL